MNLEQLSKSLKREILYTSKFRIPYLRINARWILTESFDKQELELNDLETYTWRVISGQDVEKCIQM